MAQYLKKSGKGEYLTDIVEIENARLNNLRHTVLGCMLGDFDDMGKYVLSMEIIKELISMPKYIIDTVDNIDICHGELVLDKSITFAVSFEVDCATLSLLEKVNYGANFKLNSGIYSDVIETVIDRVETSGVVDRNSIYRMWNISEFGGNRIDILSCGEYVLQKYFGITARFNYLMKANKTLLEKENELEEVEAEYFIAIINALSSYPKLKEAVVNQIKTVTREKQGFLLPDRPNYIKTLNEVLDSAIEDNLGLLNDEDKEKFLVDKQNATRDKNIRTADVMGIESVAVGINNESRIVYAYSGFAGEIVGSDYFNEDTGNTQEVTRKNVEEFVRAKQDHKVLNGQQKKKASEQAKDLGIIEEKKVEQVKESEQTNGAQKQPAAPTTKPGVQTDKGQQRPNLVKAAAGKKTKAKDGGAQVKQTDKSTKKQQLAQQRPTQPQPRQSAISGWLDGEQKVDNSKGRRNTASSTKAPSVKSGENSLLKNAISGQGKKVETGTTSTTEIGESVNSTTI